MNGPERAREGREMADAIDRPMSTWGECSYFHRLQQCRAMLHLHGCLTDAEDDKVIQRILKVTGQNKAKRKAEGGVRDGR